MGNKKNKPVSAGPKRVVNTINSRPTSPTLNRTEVVAINAARKYSKVMPEGGLLSMVEASANDPELVSLREDVELSNGFILHELATLNLENCSTSWASLEELAKVFWMAQTEAQKGDVAREMCNVIRDGASEWKKVQRIQQMQETKRKLIETQLKVEDRLKTNMSADKVAKFALTIWEVFEKLLADDPVRLARAELEIRTIMDGTKAYG